MAMAPYLVLALAAVLSPALAEETAMDSAPQFTEGESLFDDPPTQEPEFQEGESLFDDAPPSNDDDDLPPPNPNEIAFGEGTGRNLTADIVFDEAGNVKEGGSTDPDIGFWSVAEFNGERMIEPTDGSNKLLAALEAGETYHVKFTPPDLSKVKCTEKVEPLGKVLDEGWHDMSHELVQKALATLAEEGVFNTKQLGDLYEKDYDAIQIPAIVKSRLRPAREEAMRQAATANKKVEMDSQEVQDELRAFMSARQGSQPGGQPQAAEVTPQAEVVQQAAQSVEEETEEDGTFKSLVWAIMNCPTCKGKETIACLRTCRYGNPEKKESWSECLNQCITNTWIRATFRVMLPKS